MKRYDHVKQERRFDGKRVYKMTRYPTIIPRDEDVIYISNEGDYLDSLSYRFYGDPTLWWIIALANNLGQGKMSVEGGLQLRIPVNVNEILSDFSSINSE
jgi:nucleoid-associated protein YgaU